MSNGQCRFRFGLFDLDGSTGELRREGALVRLQPQPAQLLRYLVERAGHVVSRDELRSAIWGDTTFVDFDRGLNFCISQVRSALRDDSAEPRFIRTVPKQGYQFIGPVEQIAGAAEANSAIPASPRNRLRARRIAVAGAVVVVAGLGALAAYWPRLTRTSSAIVAVVRFDNETGDPGMDPISDGLTDSLVEQLTTASQGAYGVIGNARILRLPRDQRDLKEIAASLHATYVVLGQVQANGAQVRILAHLIHLPEQTHVWVVRMDQTVADPLGLQAEAAQRIAAAFSPRVAAGDRTPLRPRAK